MATSHPRALIVAPTPHLAEQLAGCLSSRGVEVSVMTDFDSARHELNVRPPHLLVTELKLGAFNGLHLALRARTQCPRVQAIVIGEADCVLQAEALRHDASYVVEPFEEGTFMDTLAAGPIPSEAGTTH